MKNADGNELIPEVGYGFVKFIAPGETESGIVVPDSAQHAEGRLVVVETSGAYVVDGMRQECAAKAGDRVWLNPHKERVQDPRGKWCEVMRPRLSPIRGMKDVFLFMLADVSHFERSAEVRH